MGSDWSFAEVFETLTGHPPFPWQEGLFEKFRAGDFGSCRTCTLPTGLGKTSIIALWLIALARHPDVVPRRLVYVVNRRTVVDQTNSVIRKYTRNRKQYPNGESALKLIYLAIHEASKKWTMPIRNWRAALNHFAILFEDRMPQVTAQ